MNDKRLGITKTELLKMIDKHFKQSSDITIIKDESHFLEVLEELSPYSILKLRYNEYYEVYATHKGLLTMYFRWHKLEDAIYFNTTKEAIIAFLIDFSELAKRKNAKKGGNKC